MTALENLLKQKQLTVYRCSQESNIPYATLRDLVNGKTDIRKCSVDTFYKLAVVLDTTMNELYLLLRNHRAVFETFKGNICHSVKEKGDLLWIIDTLKNDSVRKYWDRKWYPEAFYTLAVLDYLSRLNGIDLCHNYDQIRACKLSKPLYPQDALLLAKLSPSLDERQRLMKDSIPEFSRFNIAERNIRDVI